MDVVGKLAARVVQNRLQSDSFPSRSVALDKDGNALT